MQNTVEAMAARQTSASTKKSASESPSEIVSILHQAIVPSLIILIEHSRSLIKLFQLGEQACGAARGDSIVIDDVTPGQTLRDELFREYDLRLREALQFL